MRTLAIILILSAQLGCDQIGEPVFQANASQVLVVPPTLAVESGVVSFLNDPTTDIETLDRDVPLDLRAAEAIIIYRNGPDGLVGTSDDRLFKSLAEVDSLYWVGSNAMERLVAYVETAEWIEDLDAILGVYRGVAFSVAEGRCALAWINSSETDMLLSAGLTHATVQVISIARPLPTMKGLAELYPVDRDALIRIRSIARGEDPSQLPQSVTSNALP